MGKKILVVTAGTVAASVGQTLLKQMKAHPVSDLTVMARYIDTAYLPNRYADLRKDEWFHLSIDPRYMRAIYDDREAYPLLDRMLFPGLLPGTATTGGGSIRYNGAGAVEVKRTELRRWLSSCMTNLARAGDGSTNVSVALIVSAVGATGSGSLEHLIDVIVDAAHFANVHSTNQSTLRCDVYILQPSQDATDLGLANTLALYAEMAASQLSGGNTRSYQGRKIMIGWGSDTALASIEQLQEVAATIVRLSTDPTSAFAAEFQEREVDNHVLRELDPISSLPMHLSLSTIVTVGLGRLEEQIAQRDVNRLVNSLVFDSSVTTHGDNILLGRFADSLAGEDAQSRYQKLLEYLSEPVHLIDAQRRVDTTVSTRNIAEGEKGQRLMNIWQESVQEVKQGRHKIHDFSRSFSTSALLELDRVKGERICKGGVSLTELREEYRSLHDVIATVLEVARADVRTTVNDSPVTRAHQALSGIWPFRLLNRRTKLRRLASNIKRNLNEHLQESTRSSAIEVLDRLEQRCAEIGRNLDIVLNKLRRKHDDDQRFVGAVNRFNVDPGNRMSIVALSSLDEMESYAAQVSVFTSEEDAPEQLAEFRQWLQGRPELEALFRGNLDQLMNVVMTYTGDKVREAMQKHSVLDILHRAGEDTLRQRLMLAADKAKSLVSFSPDFAPHRREAWHVSAFYRDEDQRDELEEAMNKAFAQGQCKLLPSRDPGEIAVFYYVDGVPMSAVDDLQGRCLEAFLNRRLQWQKHKSVLDGNRPVGSISGLNMRVGVPIFSGSDAEERVQMTGVIKSLYKVRGEEVGSFRVEDLPEFQEEEQAEILEEFDIHRETNPVGTNGKNSHGNGNGNGRKATDTVDLNPKADGAGTPKPGNTDDASGNLSEPFIDEDPTVSKGNDPDGNV